MPKTRCSTSAAAATLEFSALAKTPQPRKGKTTSYMMSQRKTLNPIPFQAVMPPADGPQSFTPETTTSQLKSKGEYDQKRMRHSAPKYSLHNCGRGGRPHRKQPKPLCKQMITSTSRLSRGRPIRFLPARV